jgi:hypothetical protein
MAKNPPAANAASKQRGRPFKPGQSGNRAGKQKGTRNKVTQAIEALLDGEGEALTRKAIELGLKGDITALRLCLDRLAPPRRDRHVSFELPKIENAKDAAGAITAMLEAVAAGDLTPSEASEVTKLLDTYVKVFEAVEIAERVERLEKMVETR